MNFELIRKIFNFIFISKLNIVPDKSMEFTSSKGSTYDISFYPNPIVYFPGLTLLNVSNSFE